MLQAAIVLAPLAYGTVHALPVALFQTSAYALFLWWGMDTARKQGNWRHLHDPLLVIAAGAIALGGLQLIPLPHSILALVSPGTGYWAIESLEAMGIEPPVWRPISLAPHLTLGGILWIAALAAWYAIAREAAGNRETARSVLATMALSGAGLGLLGLLQRFTNAQAIFWIDKPRDGFFSAFVNPNNAAGLLTLGTMACLAMTATADAQKRPLWGGAAVLAAGGAVLSLSRGGIGVLVFALVLAVWLTSLRATEGDKRPVWMRLGPLYFGVALTAFVAWVGWTDVIGELGTVRQDHGLNGRVHIWADSLAGIVPRFPLFGPGYGTFEALYPAYASRYAAVTYTALENEYLHALVEGGFVGAGLAGAAVFVIARRMRTALRRRTNSRARPFMVAGTCALGVHMLIDFPLHLGGPALWILTTGALAMGAQSLRAVPYDHKGARLPRSQV